MRGGLIGRTARRLSHILTAPVQVVYRKVKRMVSPESFSSKVLSDVRKGINQKKKKKERTIQDYFSIGRYYVLKRFVYFVMLAAVVLPVLYLKLLHPILISHFFTKTMVINSPEMIGYSGNVELLEKDGGTMIFKGKMEKGRINGKGQLYTYDPHIFFLSVCKIQRTVSFIQTVFKFPFVNQIPFFIIQLPLAVILVQKKSSFVAERIRILIIQLPLPEGTGTEFDGESNTVYEGDFVNGKKEGDGKVYAASETAAETGTEASGEVISGAADSISSGVVAGTSVSISRFSAFSTAVSRRVRRQRKTLRKRQAGV